MNRNHTGQFSCAVLLLCLFPCLVSADEKPRVDVLIADFEGASYGDWKVEGEAFGTQPASGALSGQMDVSGYEGKQLVNTFLGGDRSTGRLTSPPIKIQQPYFHFLIGGGGYEDETCMNLLVDGQVVRTATGPNRKPGGSEHLQRVYWDVHDLIGKRGVLQIVDQRTGGWGHVNVDDIHAGNRSLGIPAEELSKGPNLQTFSSYEEVGYDQTYRPQFHFTSLKHWLNDPNGMVFLDGEYHLFFQHNPVSNAWGNMTWGHAVSKDMVHWKQLPHAILPYDDGTIFSGTAVVDHNNSLGVQEGDTKTIAAAFTFARHPFYQALAYSTDRGRTFQLWNDGKPIVPNQGYDPGERDPKVFWHEPTQKWVMVLWVKQAKPGRVLFFNSDDLKTWTEVSQFDRDWVFECMDMVHLPVDGDESNKRWVLYDASFEYEIGEFDGTEFTTDKAVHRGDYGPNFYAAQTFNDSPDGRSVIIGWMRGENTPFRREDMPFHQQMSFPQTMQLRTTVDGVRLFRWPVKEIESLYEEEIALEKTDVKSAAGKLSEFQAELIDFSIAFEADANTELSINLRGQKLTYKDGAVHYQNHPVPAPPIDGVVKLRVLVDRASLELFTSEGQYVATFNADIDPNNKTVAVRSPGNELIRSFKVHRLKSAW
ncbi:Levanase precursor [Bremerella volcania]|uniref:Levanase n=1 Tax=Bremerella volcania TaxID=2527984 RepID=A0A518CBZ7_9BACT|nr:glycoside hydrolase family 32 protein [Bremerella volcania]QDU76755.1 Levanase precursor [Bremerella volcania]